MKVNLVIVFLLYWGLTKHKTQGKLVKSIIELRIKWLDKTSKKLGCKQQLI